MPAIAPHIADELAAAGVLGLPFVWSETGAVDVSDPRLTPAQRATITAVFAAHDPTDAVKLAAERDARAGADFDAPILKALALVILDEVNLLRAVVVPPLTPRTPAQLRAAVIAKRRTL